MADDQEPRIIVDSDWKSQAQKEKEELERQEQETQEGGGPIPEPSLAELVQMIVMQASIGLGGFQDPRTGQRIPADLPVAKHYIDLLDLLRQKTEPNLTEEEKAIMEGTLQELRMVFVQVAGLGQGDPKQ
jgi:hypothetical protein